MGISNVKRSFFLVLSMKMKRIGLLRTNHARLITRSSPLSLSIVNKASLKMTVLAITIMGKFHFVTIIICLLYVHKLQKGNYWVIVLCYFSLSLNRLNFHLMIMSFIFHVTFYYCNANIKSRNTQGYVWDIIKKIEV